MISPKNMLAKELAVMGLREMSLTTIMMNITMIIMKSITEMITTAMRGGIMVTRMIMETMALKVLMMKRRKKITEDR